MANPERQIALSLSVNDAALILAELDGGISGITDWIEEHPEGGDLARNARSELMRIAELIHESGAYTGVHFNRTYTACDEAADADCGSPTRRALTGRFDQ